MFDPTEWIAHIKVGKKFLYLGSHETFTDAVDARSAKEQALGFTGRV